jgi:hypothetical protein
VAIVLAGVAALLLMLPAGARAQMPEPDSVPLIEVLRRILPVPLEMARPDLAEQRGWRATASHNEARADRAFTPAGWTSGVPQSGVWFQIELPEPEEIAGIQFDSAETAPRRPARSLGAPDSPGAVSAAGAPEIAAEVAPGAGPSEAPAASKPSTVEPPTVGRLGGEPASGSAPAPGASSLGSESPDSKSGAASAGGSAHGPGAPSGPGHPDPAAAALAHIGFPRIYRVQVSSDGREWSPPIAEGHGGGRRTIISFAPVTARFFRITTIALEPDLPAWSIRNLRVVSDD